MKKSAFLLGLLAITSLCLTACNNSKDFTMSFEDAIDTANHSTLQDVLVNTENFQQSLNLTTNIDNGENEISINLQSNSKQNLKNNKSESSTTFDVNMDVDNSNVLIKGDLDIKLVDNTIYLNLGSLDISGGEDLSFISAMIEGFKNQWYSIPMEGLSDVPNTLSYIKDTKNLNEQAKEVIINEGSTIYNGRFVQLSGYNSWKFSLDTEKLQQLIDEYYAKVNEALSEENQQEVPQLNIQNFEGYLVITGKDKVTTVIENMDIIEGESNININGFGGEDYEINTYTNGEPLITIKATKKGSRYNVSLDINNSLKLEGTITPKVSQGKIDIKFNATLSIKSEYEETDDTIVPLQGNRTYNSISDFDVVAPENAQNLSELLGAYLGSTLGGNSDDDLNYEDNLDVEYLESSEEFAEVE